jgi:small-conductance mechanosensitive channel
MILAAMCAWRNGFRRSDGWILLVIYTVGRVVGACMQLDTISNSSTSVTIGAVTILAVGLSPLLMAANGILHGALRSLDIKILPLAFRGLFLLLIVALALGIAGGVTSADDFTQTGIYVPQTIISLVIFLIAGFSIPPRRKSSTSRNYDEPIGAYRASNPPKAF